MPWTPWQSGKTCDHLISLRIIKETIILTKCSNSRFSPWKITPKVYTWCSFSIENHCCLEVLSLIYDGWALHLNSWRLKEGRQPSGRLIYFLPSTFRELQIPSISWSHDAADWIGSYCDLLSKELINLDICLLQRCYLCDTEENWGNLFLKNYT